MYMCLKNEHESLKKKIWGRDETKRVCNQCHDFSIDSAASNFCKKNYNWKKSIFLKEKHGYLTHPWLDKYRQRVPLCLGHATSRERRTERDVLSPAKWSPPRLLIRRWVSKLTWRYPFQIFSSKKGFLEYPRTLHNYWNIKYFIKKFLKFLTFRGHLKYSSANTEAWRPFCGAHGDPAAPPSKKRRKGMFPIFWFNCSCEIDFKENDNDDVRR